MKKHQKGLVAAVMLCILTITGMLLSLTLGHQQLRQEFAPPPFDPLARPGLPAIPEGLGWQMLDANAYHVGICGVITPQGNTVDVWLTNSKENTVWLKVRILDAGNGILGESGLIKPGEYVQSVALRSIPEPGTPVILKIMAYEPETYHSAGAVSLSTKMK